MSTPKVAPEDLVVAMEQDLRGYLQSVMQAVNDAPDGQWISGSEERVRDLSAELRKRAFEKAVQLKINAAEAAFSPSTQSDDGQAPGE